VRELKLVGWVERVWKTVDEADDLGVECRARRLLIYVSMSVRLSVCSSVCLELVSPLRWLGQDGTGTTSAHRCR